MENNTNIIELSADHVYDECIASRKWALTTIVNSDINNIYGEQGNGKQHEHY